MSISGNDKKILKWIEQYGSITIRQAADMVYKTTFGYDYARQRLKDLKDKYKILKCIHDPVLDEHLYYTDKEPTAHSNAIYNFYSNLVKYKLPIIHFQKEKQFLEGKVRADGFIVWQNQNGEQIMAFIEVDIYHNTSIKKYLDNVAQE